MLRRIRQGLAADRVTTRIAWLALVFAAVFFGATILSYYALPEGFLLRKNGLTDFRTSENLPVCTAQIFLFNMVSVMMIAAGSLFARRRAGEDVAFSYGMLGFFVFVALNGVTLGTWSFTANAQSVPLAQRLLRTFDVLHNAGLLEMLGQLCITAALATKYVMLTEGRETTVRTWRELRFTRSERIAVLCGLLLMLAGAFVESRAIVGH